MISILCKLEYLVVFVFIVMSSVAVAFNKPLLFIKVFISSVTLSLLIVSMLSLVEAFTK